MKCDIPSVHIDWFIATASGPPLYNELLSLPLTDRELEKKLDVDVVGNLMNARGIRVWRAGFNNSGVSTNNRVVERHTSRMERIGKATILPAVSDAERFC